MEKERILDALCRTPGWHRKHGLRALRRRVRREDSQDQKPA
jgi:hypothetical protein